MALPIVPMPTMGRGVDCNLMYREHFMSETIKSYFLALHIGHNCSCAIMGDGRILYVGQEERFTRQKNTMGFPAKALAHGLAALDVAPRDFERVAYTSSETSPLFTKSNYVANMSIEDYLDLYGERYFDRLFRDEDVSDYLHWLHDLDNGKRESDGLDYSFMTADNIADAPALMEAFREEQIRLLVEDYGVSPERIEFLDHHACHANYAYWGSPMRGDDVAVIVIDNWGDGRNQSVWRPNGESLEVLADSTMNDTGRMYKMATLLLGMKPDEHEYKVMGMAPYAKESYAQVSREAIGEINRVEGMRIVHGERPKNLFRHLIKVWRAHRFDNIAGGAQMMVEDVMSKLVENVHAETGARRFVLGGGISMNIKMNKILAELPCVDDIFICGSGADESLPIGGCYGLNTVAGDNAPLNDLYLGYDIDDDIAGFDWAALKAEWQVHHGVTPEQVAKLLANEGIVARVGGRAEFGARALGNRSILADPRNSDSVYRINEAIKKRDFWMPFAISIAEEKADEYVINPKGLKAPFMSIGFDTKAANYENIRAGTHPYDRSARPQFVARDAAPDYHALITAFGELTGVYSLLNTSLNLHGEPIVNTIGDALRTFELSDLDFLLAGDTLVSKRDISL
jgi:carbamoyltransferase